MRHRVVVVFGEVLFDHFEDGSERLGGAPLNVAAHLAALGDTVGVKPLMISRVGNDQAGRRALAELTSRGLDTGGIQEDPERATGAVEVHIEDGEPRYEIVSDRAWDHIDAPAALAAVVDETPAMLVHGVLATRSPASREALAVLRGTISAPRLIDVNLRPPFTPADRALELARGAAWLKLNQSELGELTAAMEAQQQPTDAASALREWVGADRLVVTWGARGAVLIGPDGEREQVAARETRSGEGDTVGAGDAFTAAVVLGICGGWAHRLTLERAAELAAAVCTLRGALPPDPSFYTPFRRAWGDTS